MNGFVKSILKDRFLQEFNRRPFGKNKEEIIEQWASKIEILANNNNIEPTSLIEKSIDTIIKVHKKSRNFVPSINVLLGKKYFEMIESNIISRNMNITNTDKIISKYNIKPLIKHKKINNILYQDRNWKHSSSLRKTFATYEENFLGDSVVSLSKIPPKPVKGNEHWEIFLLLYKLKEIKGIFPVTKRTIEVIETILFSILLHNHKEEMKTIYYENYQKSSEYCNWNNLKPIIEMWLYCRNNINNKTVTTQVEKYQVIDEILSFIGITPIKIPLRKFGTSITMCYSYSYCVIIMKLLTLAVNEMLYKGKTIIEPFLKKLAYIYDYKKLGDILSINLFLYNKIKKQKTYKIFAKYPPIIKNRVMFLLSTTTNRKKLLAVNRKARRDIEQGTVPNIEVGGLTGGKEKILLSIMSRYKIPHINPSLI